MFITRKHLHRRTVLQGARRDHRAAVPRRDGRRPARRVAQDAAAARKLRLVAMEMVHGSAGSTAFGAEEEPVVAGRRPGARSI